MGNSGKVKIVELDAQRVHSIDGKLTFYGVLSDYYEDCAKHWGETTRSSYNRDYNEKIFPNLRDHDNTPIEKYEKDDYDAAIQALVEKGKGKEDDVFVPYAEATLQHYRHIIEVVVSVAAEKGICDNVLWGSVFILPQQSTARDEENERVTLKKSLSPEEEIAVAKVLSSDVAQRGQNLGLLLMFALGLRNNEACGADYGDIKPMQTHPECKALWVYKSTTVGSNVLKSGGKTRNADRIIPIPSELEKYISDRRHYLEQNVEFAPFDEIQSIDDLPIACLEHDYKVRCSASKLTAAGREMFRRISLDQHQLAYIDADLSQEDTSDEIAEKDPTAYLLRRNFGTHLHILGLTEPEIEYVMGHDIRDAYEARNEFVNEEKQYEIKLKLDQRPLLNDEKKASEMQVIQMVPNQSYPLGERRLQKVRLKIGRGCLKIHLTTKEPFDRLEMKLAIVPQTFSVKSRSFIGSIAPKYERGIDIIKRYHRKYELCQNEKEL